jgi:hypothetical protein
MFQTKVVEKVKTRFVFSNFSENHVVYEIRWKNIVERGMPQMTLRRKRLACWILKAKKTHTQIV